MSSSSSYSIAAAEAQDNRRPLPMEPFVWNLLLQMDSCACTNKSQYAFGSLAIPVLSGILNSIECAFMT